MPAVPPRPATPPGRAGELVALLGLQPHPEGGWYREIHRSPLAVQPADRPQPRCALTSIDFLLAPGERSTWHRVSADEAWHLLEGGPLVLWLVPPGLDRIESVRLAPAGPAARPRHVVPAHWWQAAEPAGGFAYVGATVGPGFEFADFAFGRDDTGLPAALDRLDPALRRLL